MSDTGRDRHRWFARFEWKPQDLWIGLFWKRRAFEFDLWICLLPMVPLHIGWRAEIYHGPPTPEVDHV